MKKIILTAMTGMLLAAGFAHAEAGDVLVRGRFALITPDVESDLKGLDVERKAIPELDFTYFITKNIAAELILGTAKHSVSLNNQIIGKVSHLPPTVTVQYHFLPDSTIRPYVGAGLNYTRFYDIKLADGTLTVDKNSFGGALQAGVDFAVSKNSFINLDLKKIYISTDVKSTATGAKVTKLDVDPLVFGIGYGMRF
ncbi:outer membrane protein [Chitinivorax tropicus]|uniref:Outer membrane protein n=1 Tax=Chitinivorax tropicus TaxID=714531 RepID=A0A840MMZ4_9PROT|nr:OmpW family outer membrane protein [Chitinivorax tropicus]MBB5018835.1 outer membrane protein [Chitinivorax tropicus]